MTVEEARRNMIEATLNAGYKVCVDVDAVAEMLRAEEELQQYRAIGTVSEFRELKEENTELHCEMQAIGATMDLLEKEIRAKAIEEFSEQIKSRAHSTERNDWSADYMISIWESVIDEISTELKGE